MEKPELVVLPDSQTQRVQRYRTRLRPVHAAQIHRQLPIDKDVHVVVTAEGKLFATLLTNVVVTIVVLVRHVTCKVLAFGRHVSNNVHTNWIVKQTGEYLERPFPETAANCTHLVAEQDRNLGSEVKVTIFASRLFVVTTQPVEWEEIFGVVYEEASVVVIFELELLSNRRGLVRVPI
jgi:hypothetical protein